MKKILCFLTALSVFISLAGCATNPNQNSQEETRQTTTQAKYIYHTKETIIEEFEKATTAADFELPKCQAEESSSSLAFYTYEFEKDVKVIIKVIVSHNQLSEIEIDAPIKTDAVQKDIIKRLMNVITTVLEVYDTEDTPESIADAWFNLEVGGDPYASTVGIIYNNENFSDVLTMYRARV